jgi:hypothetical protein
MPLHAEDLNAAKGRGLGAARLLEDGLNKCVANGTSACNGIAMITISAVAVALSAVSLSVSLPVLAIIVPARPVWMSL